jgi:hypothetical protein
MHLTIAESSLSLNSDILETNILNLLVIIGALGVLIRQYFDSVVQSYEVLLYDVLADSYSLEKEVQMVNDTYISTLSVLIRIHLNALLSSKMSSIETKALVFIRTECMRQRILEFEQKTTQIVCQNLFESWYRSCFNEIKEELVSYFKNDLKKQEQYIDLKIQELETTEAVKVM